MKLKTLLGTLLIFFSCLTLTAWAIENVVFSGSATMKDRIFIPNHEAMQEAIGVHVGMRSVNSNQGFKDLLAGKVVASIAGTTVKNLLARNGLEDDGTYQQHTIIDDVISPVVHASNPISELSWKQLTAIFTGEITNWKDVGGKDLPIKVVTGKKGTATRSTFQKQVMKGRDITDNAAVVDVSPYEILYICRNPGSIGAVSHALVTAGANNLKALKTDTISRPLVIITKGDPGPVVQKVIDFLRSPEAQRNFK